MDFLTTIYNVLIMFFYLIPAFILDKVKLAEAAHSKTLSSILLYICFPAMILNAFQKTEFGWDILAKIGEFTLTVLILMLLVLGCFYFALRKKYEDPRYRILTISTVFGNVGFFGNPLIKSIFPDAPIVQCYSSVYTIIMFILSFSIGVFCLSGDRKYISVKQTLLNPGTVTLLVALVIYLTKWHFPEILGDAVELLGKMTTPICMHILGIRLASVNILSLFKRPFVYIVCAIKLIAFPLFAFLCVYFIPFFDKEFKCSVLILSATPCAAVILSLAELYGCEQELSADVVLVSTLICIITLPVVSLLNSV